MDKLLKILAFLRITDADDNKLSLTNIAVWIALFKLISAANLVTPIDLGALLTALAAYHGKKMLRNGADE